MKVDTKEAAAQFEAYFLRQVLAEARGSDGGFAGSTFKEMFDGAIADAMSSGQGIGLREEIAHELEGGAAPAERKSISPLAHATKSRVSSAYGERTDPINGAHKMHDGIDVAAPEGSSVRAVQDGIVKRAEATEGYGNLVVIDHGGGLETRYAHLREIKVAPGASIRAGEALGSVGTTGRSTGPHLHFEARRDGKPFDPARFIEGLKSFR